MQIDQSLLKKVGLGLPEILLPLPNIPPETWAVVACDQHTSNPQYWEKISEKRGNNPSTFDIIFPETWLGDDDEVRIKKIHDTMDEYIHRNYLQNKGKGWIYVQRYTQQSGLRQGITLTIDLEQYGFIPSHQNLIRPTEHIIPERLGPRKTIREGAVLELSHIIVLIDDPERGIIEQLKQETGKMKKIYDFELMMDGGQLKGYWLDNPELINNIARQLWQLFKSRDSDQSLCFAVGDGNHSLAAAKSLWEDIRKNQLNNDPVAIKNHPARYAMVEIINAHDSGLNLEAIHRCLFNIPVKAFFSLLKQEGFTPKLIKSDIKEALSGHRNGAILYARGLWYLISDFGKELACEIIDRLFQKSQQTNPHAKIDFVHEWKYAQELIDEDPDRIGVFFNPIRQEDLFPLIAEHEILPRKSFSLGESSEKSYYFEARRIR